jgi:hypothetical protein
MQITRVFISGQFDFGPRHGLEIEGAMGSHASVERQTSTLADDLAGGSDGVAGV